MDLIKRLAHEEEGADATEYALMVGLIALGVVVAAGALGGKLSDAFNNIGTSVANHTAVQ